MAGSTISAFLSLYKTKAQSRSLIQEFRTSYGDIVDLNERTVELVKGESVTIDADHFMLFTCSEELPVSLTTYNLVDEDWVANTPVDVRWQGVMSWPGKISISINNPADNTSDLPYRLTAVYS